MFLNMIMFIKEKNINHTYKMGVIKQIDIKNRTYYFYNDFMISKILMQDCQKLIKNHIKTLVFTIMDISQRKKLMIVKILTALILCI